MLRKAKLSDAPAIARVQVKTWRATYQDLVPKTFLEELSIERQSKIWAGAVTLSRTDHRVWVAEKSDQVVGFVAAGRTHDAPEGYAGEVFALYVLPKAQRQGIGRALLTCALAFLASKGLIPVIVWVLRDNPYRSFYERLGGEPATERTIELGGQAIPEVGYRFSPGRAGPQG